MYEFTHLPFFGKFFLGGVIVLSEAEVKLYCIQLNLDLTDRGIILCKVGTVMSSSAV